jgi:pyridoxal phosphate enzyme (YggS family)
VSTSEVSEPGATIAANVADVRARIAAACGRAGRDPAGVTLVAVTKTVPLDAVRAVLAAGVADLGENRAQELLEKAPAIVAEDARVRWHFVGRLQRNKVRALAAHVDSWHSLDRVALVDELARRAPGARTFVQVDLAGEPQKGGCAPDEVGPIVEAARGRGLDVRGLMTVPPRDADPRPHFARLRTLAVEHALPELSMGMSGDFEVAVEEGATVVRVGSALFGPRRAAGPLRR